VEQTAELAAGLEASGHRFLWVVRMPSMDGEEHRLGKNNNPLAWLPEGFLERTKDKGLAVAAWAPQVRVLSHPATAAFVSHCGWNSTLESVSCGVPMIAWPMYVEQRMNAVVLEESVGLALRVRPRARDADGDGVVVLRGEIADVVRELMEGAEKGRAVRRQAGDMQQAAARAWAPEGSSRRALEEVAVTWKASLRRRGEVTDMSASGKR
jgi:hydroquinone glucosyltransferase